MKLNRCFLIPSPRRLMVPITLFLSLGLFRCADSFEEASNPKIVNGTKADANSEVAKHTVALTERGQPYCTGTLIQDFIILTAAHCLVDDERSESELQYRRKVSVTFGLGFLPENQLVTITANTIPHEDYDGLSNLNDVALLKLDQTPPSFVSPVKLAKREDYKKGTELILAGYGIHGFDKENKAIEGEPGALYETQTVIDIIDDDKNLIIYQSSNGLNSGCHGDSGGPMFMKSGNELVQIGVTQGPDRENKESLLCHGRGVYTQISAFEQWIEENT